jgi:hypothetical protein
MNEQHLGFPEELVMSEEDGLVENHHYRDLRGFSREAFDIWVRDERILLDTPHPENEPEEGNAVWDMDIDPGVATTVAALSIIGACPVTSCSGQPGHYEKHPLVLVWCTESQFALMEKAAESAGVNLTGVGEPGILVWSDCLEDMVDFAKCLVEEYDACVAQR